MKLFLANIQKGDVNLNEFLSVVVHGLTDSVLFFAFHSLFKIFFHGCSKVPTNTTSTINLLSFSSRKIFQRPFNFEVS